MISEKKLKKALNKKVSWFFGPSLGGGGRGVLPPYPLLAMPAVEPIIEGTVSWRLTHSLSDDFVLCEANKCVGEEKGNAMTDQLESSNRQAVTSVGA